VLGLVLTAGLIGATLAGPGSVAAPWWANLGALAQARVELAAYDPDRWDTLSMDEVRRREDLRHAEGLLRRAIEAQPGNRTARQRLAAIALSRGEYEDALRHGSAAWEAGHRDGVTRLLLGDAFVATGQIERAAEIVRGLEWAVPRLMGYGWYRYWVNEDYDRAASAWRTVLLLDPGSVDAIEGIDRAEDRLAGEGY
jgi:predicted Zn-dependent protease